MEICVILVVLVGVLDSSRIHDAANLRPALPRMVLDPLVFFPIRLILSLLLGLTAFVEPILLLVLFLRLERKLGRFQTQK
jgi:hypothetical protein